jgi:hypothetical protein
MTGTIIAKKPGLRKQMHLDKVDTYDKACTAPKVNLQATAHSKMLNSNVAVGLDINFVSSNKKGQKTTTQAAQKFGGGHSSSHVEHGSGYGRGGP